MSKFIDKACELLSRQADKECIQQSSLLVNLQIYQLYYCLRSLILMYGLEPYIARVLRKFTRKFAMLVLGGGYWSPNRAILA